MAAIISGSESVGYRHGDSHEQATRRTVSVPDPEGELHVVSRRVLRGILKMSVPTGEYTSE